MLHLGHSGVAPAMSAALMAASSCAVYCADSVNAVSANSEDQLAELLAVLEVLESLASIGQVVD